ncbi:MAG TPA: hydroxymethylbilane synthase [Acidobacteriota bacterium]|nr:hydroxymethylbilane synthase [Acidobacteriota bacterium]
MKPLIIGSRGSRLALWQSNFIREGIQRKYPDLQVEIAIIKTTGDKISETGLGGLSGTGKGVFIKEIEEALLREDVDLAVHSLKDVPTELAPQFTLAAIPPRADVRDALVAEPNLASWQDLPPGARLGTSSLRRTVQLRLLRKDFEIHTLRGNVDTRIRKRIELGLDGVVLAAAGLARLGLERHVACFFPPELMVPAVGQGALAVETRTDDERVRAAVAHLDDPATRLCTDAERLFLKRMGGGCQVPMGAHAEIKNGTARFTALLASPTGADVIRHTYEGKPAHLPELAEKTVEYLLSHGAERILKEIQP